MTTPELSGAVPVEATVLDLQSPKLGETPRIGGASPGISAGYARIPGGPTLPDPDPTGFAAALAKLATELFTAPSPSAGAASAPSAPTFPQAAPDGVSSVAPQAVPPGAVPSAAPATGVSTSGAPIGSAPVASPVSGVPANDAPAGSAPAGVGESASPFSAPLNFDWLSDPNAGAIGDSVSLRIPLISEPAVEAAPVPVEKLEPAPSNVAAPPTSEPKHAQYEIEPVSELNLRPSAGTIFDPHAVRREFPILKERVHGKQLVWLDNAATTQKPQVVIDRLKLYYERENSNIHRAAHTLAARATDAYEGARETAKRFINAPSKDNIVFVRGATEGINLVAQSWGRRNVAAGDEIVVSWLEHHANIVPWQQLCAEKGARLRVAPVDDRGQIILEEYEKLLGPRTRIVAFTQVSNALGTVTPAAEMIALAHRHGAKVLLDGAQAVSHMSVDVQALDCDFYVFSGHKVFAPTGIGVVYGKSSILEVTPPWQGGGNMIQDVTFERTVYQPPPARFEAGTGNIADAVGLGAALDWLMRLGLENVHNYEHELLVYGTERLATVPGLTLIGTPREKAGVLSFILAGQKTEEVGGLLDREGIAVRSGHHCAQPILRRFGLEATVRASFAPYNTFDDIDALVAALKRLQAGHVAVV